MRKHFFFKIIFLTKAALPSLVILLILSMILIIVNTSTIRAKKLSQLPRIEYTIILNKSFADSGLDDVALKNNGIGKVRNYIAPIAYNFSDYAAPTIIYKDESYNLPPAKNIQISSFHEHYPTDFTISLGVTQKRKIDAIFTILDVAKQFNHSPYWTEISREGTAKAPNHITFANAHKDIITLYVGSYHGGYMPWFESKNAHLKEYIHHSESSMRYLMKGAEKFDPSIHETIFKEVTRMESGEQKTYIIYDNDAPTFSAQQVYDFWQEKNTYLKQFLEEYENIPAGDLSATTDWIIPKTYAYSLDSIGKTYEYYYYRRYPMLMELDAANWIGTTETIENRIKLIQERNKSRAYITIFNLQESLHKNIISQKEFEYKLNRWALLDYLDDAIEFFDAMLLDGFDNITEYNIEKAVWQKSNLNIPMHKF